MWLPQLLLAIIAACAAWIAFQQWVTARLKLNHDLFERRFAVYVATQEHMASCLNSRRGDVGDTGPFLEAWRLAPFLFDKELNEFLTQVWRHSATIQVFGRSIDQPELRDYQSKMNDYHAAQQWLMKELHSSTERFYPSLNLSNIKPFSMTEIPIPDIEAIKSKILRKE